MQREAHPRPTQNILFGLGWRLFCPSKAIARFTTHLDGDLIAREYSNSLKNIPPPKIKEDNNAGRPLRLFFYFGALRSVFQLRLRRNQGFLVLDNVWRNCGHSPRSSLAVVSIEWHYDFLARK